MDRSSGLRAPWINLISNNYGLGHDDLYTIQNRGRIHTDNSVEIKYYDHPERFLDKMAFSFTGDLGCEFGPSTATLAGVACHGDKRDRARATQRQFPARRNRSHKQSFVGWMLYNRHLVSRKTPTD